MNKNSSLAMNSEENFNRKIDGKERKEQREQVERNYDFLIHDLHMKLLMSFIQKLDKRMLNIKG